MAGKNKKTTTVNSVAGQYRRKFESDKQSDSHRTTIYTTDERDISGYDHQKYMSSIKENFQQLHRLIKPSNFDEKVFHPVIFKVGTGRRGTMGIVDMDADFQYVAKECGFVLWDKLYNHLASPWAAVNWERNYKNKYVQKNYETNLVFVKFGKG